MQFICVPSSSFTLSRLGFAIVWIAATAPFHSATAQNTTKFSDYNHYGNAQTTQSITSSPSHNAPQDDMGSFLADRGIVSIIGEQVSQASRIVSNRASDLVVNAMGFLGVPYKRGGNSAETGFDCSGFVKAMYEQTIGHVLPRRSAEQAAATQPIDKTELQPGDLVFFNTLRSAFSHVGIYVGDNKFIHSPRTGSVVRVEDMRIGYWSSRFDGARRVQPNEAAKKP